MKRLIKNEQEFQNYCSEVRHRNYEKNPGIEQIISEN